MHWYYQSYSRQTFEGHFAALKVLLEFVSIPQEESSEDFTNQDGDRALLEIIKPANWRLSSLFWELNISSLNNRGELERRTQIIFFCSTNPSTKNSKTLFGNFSTKTLQRERLLQENKESCVLHIQSNTTIFYLVVQ